MTCRFSVIVPTLNEAHRIAHTLANAQSRFGNDAEYIVTDGGSSDGTCATARESGARVIVGAAGRGEQLDRAFREARGEVCVFLHADTSLPANARDAIEMALEDERVVGGAFSIEFDEAQLPWLARAINARSKLSQTATGDQAMFARTSALRQIGGVPRVPLFEDVRLCRALRRAGRFVILKERVRTSARLWQSTGTLRGILLHWSFRLLHAVGVSPTFLARHYPRPR